MEQNHDGLELVGGECDLPIETAPRTPEQLSLFDESSADAKRVLGEKSLEAFVQGISNVGEDTSQLPHGFDKGVLLALREGGKLFSLGINSIDFELQGKNHLPIVLAYSASCHQVQYEAAKPRQASISKSRNFRAALRMPAN